MTAFEKQLLYFVSKFNDFVNNVILAEKLPLSTIIFFRTIPWIILTTTIGLKAKPFYWSALFFITLFFFRFDFFISNFFNIWVARIFI